LTRIMKVLFALEERLRPLAATIDLLFGDYWIARMRER